MPHYSIFPNKKIHREGSVSKAFLDKGINNFHEACEYVLQLPYGRTSDKSDWNLVLIEGRGTCSTKHALISVLASELNMDVHLILGIYPMKEINTPGVGKILENSGYEYLPEAHCYLMYKDYRIDLSGISGSDVEPINEFLHEERISPLQIGKYKQDFHQNYIKQWADSDKFEEIWSLREACIEALST